MKSRIPVRHSLFILVFAYPWFMFLTQDHAWVNNSMRAVAICIVVSILCFSAQIPNRCFGWIARQRKLIILTALVIIVIGNFSVLSHYRKKHQGFIVSVSNPWNAVGAFQFQGVGTNPITIGLGSYYQKLREYGSGATLFLPEQIDELNPGNVRLFYSSYAKGVADIGKIKRSDYSEILSERNFNKLRTRVRHEEVQIGERQSIDFFLVRPRLGIATELWAYRFEDRFIWIDGRLRSRVEENQENAE